MDTSCITNVLLACLTVLIFLHLIWFIYGKILFYVWNVPPGPTGVPLLGYGPFITEHPYKDFVYLNKTYGKLCSLNMGTKRCVIVSDYDTAKKLLCHPATLSRPDNMLNFSPGKGGLSGMNGKKWVLERRLVMHSLRNIGLGKELWGSMILEDLTILIDSIIVQNGKQMNLYQPLYRTALSGILCLVMGRPIGHEIIKDHFESICEATELTKGVLKNFIPVLFPWMVNFFIKLNIDRFGKLKGLMSKLENTMREKIAESLKYEHNQTTNFVQEYTIGVKKQRGCETISDASVECLIGNIASFLVTTDTVVVATEWIFHLMASNPTVQAKVQAEIDDVMGKNTAIRWEDREKLPYTMACILEMERWESVVPVPAPRSASETFQFEGNTILKGTIILTNIWALNRDPKYWDQPSEYIPARMLKSKAENLSTIGGYAPFSLGKRNCPAERISLMITFLLFTTIMQRFTIRIPPGGTADCEQEYNGTLNPKNPNLCLTERK